MSTRENMFPFMYIMSRSSLIAHLKILDDVTLGSSFLGLNTNFNGLWLDFKNFFRPNKLFPVLSGFLTIASASFSMFLLFGSAAVNILDRYDNH